MSARGASPGLAVALALAAALALAVSWLQGRFDRADVRRAIGIAMQHRPAAPVGPSVLDALVGRGEGDPRCEGEVLSALFGDVRVRCVTPARPAVVYAFRVLLDGRRSPRPEGAAAAALVEALRAPDPTCQAGRSVAAPNPLRIRAIAGP